MKTQKEQIKLVGLAFDALSHVFYSHHTNYANELFEQCLKEEKGHRGFGDDFGTYHPNSATLRQCAKMFAVKRVAEYVIGGDFPKGKEFLHITKSCFYAAGIADEYAEQVKEAWNKYDLAELSAFDYVLFVSPEKAKVAA